MADSTAPPATTERLKPGLLPNLRHDLPASLVVFLVALPLCLGIALASGAPLFSGILSGVIGGIVVGLLSGSHVSVSGPAAGLTVIVAGAIGSLGTYETFLMAVLIAGALQVALSFMRAGLLVDFVPTAVIKGMMAAIGLVIILKQIPHALGRDTDFQGDLAFVNVGDGLNTFEEIIIAIVSFSPGALVIASISLALLLLWDRPLIKKSALSKVPAPLLVVLLGIGLNLLFQRAFPDWYLQESHRVQLPIAASVGEWLGFLRMPNWTGVANLNVWVQGATIAVVATLESLLALEATDKLDPFRRISNKSRELRAQGIGNAVSALVGGLPVTSVVVRSSANVFAGARSRGSAIYHGALLLLTAMLVPSLLNLIPLASLASILIVLGYKLASVRIFREMIAAGRGQWIPFLTTVVAIVFTDLLTGVVIGIALGLFFVLRTNQRDAFTIVSEDHDYLLRFNRDVTFVNKAELKQKLSEVPDDARLTLNAGRARTIDADIHEVIYDFAQNSRHRNISITYQHYEMPTVIGSTAH